MKTVLLDSIDFFRKNKELIWIPLVESIAGILVFVAYVLIALFGGLIITLAASKGFNGLVIILAYAVAALTGFFIVSTAVTSFFTSILICAVDETLRGVKVSNDQIIHLGLKRFHRLFKAYLALTTVYVMALLPLIPAALVFNSNPATAAGFALISLATLISISLLILFATKPLTYQIAISEGNLKTDLDKSINYFKTHAIQTALMIFAITITTTLLYAPFTIITGFFQLLDIIIAPIGSIIAVTISIPILLTINATTKTIETIWWIKTLYRK